MKPETGECRECGWYGDHIHPKVNVYICPNCGHSTETSWDEIYGKLADIEERWLKIKREHPERFKPERLAAIRQLRQQADYITKAGLQ